MASITIRNLDEKTTSRLRMREAHHNRSMAEEARSILCSVLAEEHPSPVESSPSDSKRLGPLGGIDIKLPTREPLRAPKPRR